MAKTSTCLTGLLFVALALAGCASEQARQSKLQAQARLTRAEAEAIALKQAPGSKVEEAELEKEHGRLIWSFELTKEGQRGETDVEIDANTGSVISVENENDSEEKKEKQEAEKPSAWKGNLKPADQTFSDSGRNRFFLLEPGYQLVLSGKEDGEDVLLTVTVLKDTKTVDGIPTRVVEERETRNGKLQELSRNYFAIGTETKTVYYFGEDVDVYKKDGKVVHEGAWLSGVDGAKYGIAVPGEVRVGQKYYQEQAPKVALDRGEHVAIDKVVETPAGVFTNCLQVKETTPLEPDNVEYKFYAPEVGLIADGALKLSKCGFIQP